MRRLLASLMLAGTVVLAGAGSAAAHNELIGSDPADGATVSSSPARVTLTFDQPVRPGFSTVIVTGPDQTQWQAGAAADDDATVSMPVRRLELAGQHTIAYQVLSADGHPVRGAVRFTFANPDTGVTGPGVTGQSQPGEPVSNPPVSEAPSASTDSVASRAEVVSPPVWPWLVGGVVGGAVVVVAVTMTLRVSRRR